MLCDVCQRAATGWCKGCGAFLCDDHGGERCFRCHGAFMALERQEPTLENAVYTVDRDSRWAGKGYLQCAIEPKMPTVYLDDTAPPSCAECGALARQLCSHCFALFCPQHAGTKTLCRRCVASSRMGMVILGVVFLFLAALFLLWRWN